MDIFLRFKNKSHDEAYRLDYQLQLGKRAAMVTISAIALVIAGSSRYIVNCYHQSL